MNLRILHCSFINQQSAISIEVIFSVVRLKNVKVRGKKQEIRREKKRRKAAEKKANSAVRLVKTQIPRLGSKLRGPRKTVGPTSNPLSRASENSLPQGLNPFHVLRPSFSLILSHQPGLRKRPHPFQNTKKIIFPDPLSIDLPCNTVVDFCLYSCFDLYFISCRIVVYADRSPAYIASVDNVLEVFKATTVTTKTFEI